MKLTRYLTISTGPDFFSSPKRKIRRRAWCSLGCLCWAASVVFLETSNVVTCSSGDSSHFIIDHSLVRYQFLTFSPTPTRQNPSNDIFSLHSSPADLYITRGIPRSSRLPLNLDEWWWHTWFWLSKCGVRFSCPWRIRPTFFEMTRFYVEIQGSESGPPLIFYYTWCTWWRRLR